MRRIIALGLSLFVYAGFFTIGAPPAQATRPNPDVDECSTVGQWSVPSVGRLKFSWTTKCKYGMGGYRHNLNVYRNGDEIASGHPYCSSAAIDLKVCVGSITVDNPSGDQDFRCQEIAQIWYNPSAPPMYTHYRTLNITR